MRPFLALFASFYLTSAWISPANAVNLSSGMGKELILPGMNSHKAEFTRETVKPREDVSAEKSNFHLKVAGEAMQPPGCEYVGSFASHVYKDRIDPKSFTTISQTPIGNAHEVWTDVAFKELKKVLMAKFGRSEPKTRK